MEHHPPLELSHSRRFMEAAVQSDEALMRTVRDMLREEDFFDAEGSAGASRLLQYLEHALSQMAPNIPHEDRLRAIQRIIEQGVARRERMGRSIQRLDLPIDDLERLDTTAEQLREGRDMQGIPWHTTHWTREEYRARRDADYKSYFNLEDEVRRHQDRFDREATPAVPVGQHERSWVFYRNWREIRSSIVHFQLRHLVAMTSAHDVFYCQSNRIMHCNLFRRTVPYPLMDVSGLVATSVAPRLGAFPVCTLAARWDLVAAGGFGGELILKRLGSAERFDAAVRVTNSDNGITNAIQIYQSITGSIALVLSNNDEAVRVVDAATCNVISSYSMPWAVNCTASCPMGRLLCVVGDDPESVILDPSSGGAAVARLRGHADYSFACAWHPDGNVIATGNQDLTTRVYDLRYTKGPLALLQAHIGAVRSLRFSPDGRYLAMAEPADYVTLYDVAAGYRRSQTIDFFGELAGVCFDPDDSSRFMIAVSDVHYGSLIQFNRRWKIDPFESRV